jgi:hypothetical protein
MPERDTPAPCETQALCDGVLLGCALIAGIAGFRMANGSDPEGSETIAELVGQVGSLARVAPLIRFVDAPADQDPAAERLTRLHGELNRLRPLMVRLARRETR